MISLVWWAVSFWEGISRAFRFLLLQTQARCSAHTHAGKHEGDDVEMMNGTRTEKNDPKLYVCEGEERKYAEYGRSRSRSGAACKPIHGANICAGVGGERECTDRKRFRSVHSGPAAASSEMGYKTLCSASAFTARYTHRGPAIGHGRALHKHAPKNIRTHTHTNKRALPRFEGPSTPFSFPGSIGTSSPSSRLLQAHACFCFFFGDWGICPTLFCLDFLAREAAAANPFEGPHCQPSSSTRPQTPTRTALH